MTDSTRREPDEPATREDTSGGRHTSSEETVVQPVTEQPVTAEQPAASEHTATSQHSATSEHTATSEHIPTSEHTGSRHETAAAPTARTQPVRGSHAIGREDPASSSDTWRQDTEDRRREEYGGFNWGAAFFGWLVAIALTVLIASIVGAIAAGLGDELNFTQTDAQREAGTVAISTAIALLVVLMIAYFAGGYVAGRMSRYDGGRQGLGVWVIGLVITIIVVLIGLITSEEYDIFQRVNLPAIPIPTDALTTGGLITLAAVLLGTLLAAFLGGKTGQRYHRKIDRITA